MNPLNYTDSESLKYDISKVFKFLSADEAVELCSYLELHEWQADDVVMKEGDDEDYMGFLIEGKLAVKKKTGYWGKHIIIAILEKGAMVGEGAFIDNEPRSSTIIAMEPCRLLVFRTKKMEELIANNPHLAIKIMRRMLHITSVRLRKAGERISELL